MIWTVAWTRGAEDAFMEFWLSSSERRQISEAADEAERLLAFDPEDSGDYLHEDLYSLDFLPLRLHYVINATEQLVTVVAVSMHRPQ